MMANQTANPPQFSPARKNIFGKLYGAVYERAARPPFLGHRLTRRPELVLLAQERGAARAAALGHSLGARHHPPAIALILRQLRLQAGGRHIRAIHENIAARRQLCSQAHNEFVHTLRTLRDITDVVAL